MSGPVTTLKTGGNIPKLLNAWTPIYGKLKFTPVGQELTNKAIENVSKVTKPIEESTLKASKRNSKVASLLLQLWNSGAFKGVIDKRTGKLVTYERAVDGLMGRMTRLAIENNKNKRESIKINIPKKVQEGKPVLKSNNNIRYITTSGGFIPLQIQEKSNLSVKPYMEEAGDFLGHNPVALLIEDVDRNNSNKLANFLFEKRPFNGRTITSLPSLQMEELKKLVLFARNQGKSNFLADEMYPKMYGYNYTSVKGINGEDRSNLTGLYRRIDTPRERLEHTLGSFRFYNDLNGNTIVEDTYDYNDHLRQHGESKYASVRNWAGKFASKASDSDKGKIRYKINLGRL